VCPLYRQHGRLVVVRETEVVRRRSVDDDVSAARSRSRRSRVVGAGGRRSSAGRRRPVAPRRSRCQLVVQLVDAAQPVAKLTHPQAAGYAAAAARPVSDQQRQQRAVVDLERAGDPGDVVDSLHI